MKLKLLLLFLLLPSVAFSSTRLYYNDFENSSTWTNGLRSTTNLARSSVHAYAGSYAVKGSLKRDTPHCVTGVLGAAVGPELVVSNLVANTPNAVYVSYWLRYDNDTTDPDLSCAAQKLGYMNDDVAGASGPYWAGRLISDSCLYELRYCNDGSGVYCNQTWASSNWGGVGYVLSNANVSKSAKGVWRHIEWYINYSTNPDQWTVWVDGYQMHSGTVPFGGDQYFVQPYHMVSFSILYDQYFNTDGSTDGGANECASGFTVDEIEIWDGMPDAAPDTTPTAFSFTDNTDVAASTVIYSDSITVLGIDSLETTSIALTGTDCFYQVNGTGSWLTSGDNVSLNDTIALKTTSLAAASTPQQTSCTLTLDGSVSDTWFVTTIAVPNIPTPITPTEDESGVSRPVSFSWSTVTGATLYQIQIATDSAFTDIVIDAQTVNTTYEATTLLPGMRYYWRVRALQ